MEPESPSDQGTNRVVTMTPTRRRRRIALSALIAILSLGLLAAWYFRDEGGPRLPPEEAEPAPTEPNEPAHLMMLRPGTVVGGPSPPSGWSDPVILTVTHLASGDIDTLPAFARKTATRFRTAILADVGRESPGAPYRLRRVGAGLCLEVGGKDTVISSATAERQGVEIGTIDGLVLARAERALGRSHLTARTPTFALYETFVELADPDGVHHPIVLHYALVVDPETGSLRTAYWATAEAPEQRQPVDSLTLLPRDCLFECGIHISARRVFGKVAASWRFAMVDLPPGEKLAMTPELKEFATRRLADEDGPEVERAVRESLGDRTPPEK